MRPYYPYPPGSSTSHPAGNYPHQYSYNADFDRGFLAGHRVGYRDGLEEGMRLLQQEILRSQYPYPLSFPNQGGGGHFPTRVTAPVPSMPTLSTAPSMSHPIAPPMMSMPHSDPSFSFHSPFVNYDYRSAATAAYQPQASTSVTASGYPIGSSLLSSTQTAVGTSAPAEQSLISHPNQESIAHPSTSHVEAEDRVSDRVTPEDGRQSTSSAQLTNDASDYDDEIIDVGS